jgi:hypothetical protein
MGDRNKFSRFGFAESKDFATTQKGVNHTMNTNGKLFGIFCRATALSFVVAGSASLMQAQQSAPTEPAVKAPLLMASASALDLGSSSSSSSSDAIVDSNGKFLFGAAALDGAQPPPRRYGRPRYSGGNTNADGSNKLAFMVGGGVGLPTGNTKKYDTPSWAVQGGVGRNWSKSFGVMAQFDYDHLGLQGATIANQEFLYDYGCPAGTVTSGECGVYPLDGNSHVWSFTLNPTFTLATEGSLGAYAVVGGGFYHKVTDFVTPVTAEGYDYYYGPYEYQANETIDHYTSNAAGVNGGIGLTYKLSKFSNERLYMEARYVVVFNPQRYGVTASSSTATLNAYQGNNLYPANSNRTTYVPITVGIRF